MSALISTSPTLIETGSWMALPMEVVLLDGAAQTLADEARAVGVTAVKERAEFVSADARQGVGPAYARAQHFGQGAQRMIAGGVSVGVVDELELVDVDVKQRVAVVLAVAAAAQELVHAPFELGAVDGARERVMAGAPGDGLGALAARGDVAQLQAHAIELAGGVGERREQVIDADRDTVTTQ
jgi:hypothetical protein